MGRIIKDILILFAITLVAGLALGAVFNFTKDARDEQEDKTIKEAYEKVMPGVDSYETATIKMNGKDVKVEKKILAALNKEIAKEIKSKESETDYKPYKEYKATINKVLLAKDKDKKDLGYIITVTDEEAYDGSLQMTVGIDMNGSVRGISFLDISETPGLGMKAQDENFLKQYYGKDVDFFTYTKTKSEKKSEVDAISSATITTNAVTHGVDACLCMADHLGGESHE